MRLALASTLALVLAAGSARADVFSTVTFEGVPGLSSPESVVNDADAPSVGDGSFVFAGNAFNNHYDDTFGPYWDGWALSNQKQVVSDQFDYMNQYLAAPRGGAGGSSNYAVAYSPVSSFRTNYATITLADGQAAYSIDVTNTLYAVTAIQQGDGYARPFEQGDYFRLAIEGLDASGSVVGSVLVDLADYTSGNALDWTVLESWRTVDLTSLGAAARSLRFNFETTDLDTRGEARTPLYAAVDNFTTVSTAAVPEPSTWALMGLGLAGAGLVGRRRKIAR